MKKLRYSPDQVVFGVRQAKEGTPEAEVCRKMGIIEQTYYQQTFYHWRKSFMGWEWLK